MGRLDFAQLLDEKLRETISNHVDVRQVARSGGPAAPPHPLLFAVPCQSVRASTYPAAASRPVTRSNAAARVAPPTAASPSAAQSPRAAVRPAPIVTSPSTARGFTQAEAESLQMLNGLGARLASDFTMSDLRSAYRRLARRYHPDRHPEETGPEHLRWARLFAEITKHHRTLTQALERLAN